MCYSALLTKSYKQYCKNFGATLDLPGFSELYQLREARPDLKVPDSMTGQLLEVGGAFTEQIEASNQRWLSISNDQRQHNIDDLILAIASLESKALSKTAANSVAAKKRKLDRLLQEVPSSMSNGPEHRIYPNYFAPVVIDRQGQRLLTPMRFRILPRSGVEVPSSHNVFNARRDSLQIRRTWKPLFGHQHAIFPFDRFFEWVRPGGGKPVEVSFLPEGRRNGMWAAALFEEAAVQGGILRSFAMITDDPPPEVTAAGHDRCPVFISESQWSSWLNPNGKTKEELDGLLDSTEPVHFACIRT